MSWISNCYFPNSAIHLPKFKWDIFEGIFQVALFLLVLTTTVGSQKKIDGSKHVWWYRGPRPFISRLKGFEPFQFHVFMWSLMWKCFIVSPSDWTRALCCYCCFCCESDKIKVKTTTTTKYFVVMFTWETVRFIIFLLDHLYLSLNGLSVCKFTLVHCCSFRYSLFTLIFPGHHLPACRSKEHFVVKAKCSGTFCVALGCSCNFYEAILLSVSHQ